VRLEGLGKLTNPVTSSGIEEFPSVATRTVDTGNHCTVLFSRSLDMLHISNRNCKTRCSTHNAVDSYSGGDGFESRSEYRQS
jgi:hypothetical protein